MSDAKPIAQPALTPAQEQAAVRRIHESLALQSGAGCGKTYVLARRFTELLLACGDHENPLSRFVALTFTDKAALEMVDRVRRMLREFAAQASPSDRQRLLAWLDDISQARISTIHSFCSSLPRAHAIEAGVDPAFSVLADDLAAGRMLTEAADEALLASVEGQRGDVAALLTRIDYNQALELVERLLNLRTAVDLPAYRDGQATFDRWQAHAKGRRDDAIQDLRQDQAVRTAMNNLSEMPCSDNSDSLHVMRTQLLALVKQLLEPDAAPDGEFLPDVFAQIAAIAPGNRGGKKAWDSAKECREAIKSLRDLVKPYAIAFEPLEDLDRQAADALATLVQVALEADELYRTTKRDAGVLDFEDLLFHTYRLLTENPAVRARLAAQIDQLLIDECQDTDGFQLRMLMMLIQGQLGSQQGADPFASVADGKLFVVGDIKQSIYRFRGAQVEIFRRLCESMGKGRQESLDECFRTHEAGIEFINDLFAKLMPAEYSPITARRKTAPSGPSVEILLAASESMHNAGDATAAQAAVTAQRIRQMLDSGERIVWDAKAGTWRAARAGDIAILFARMTNSLEYERQLARRDVPYYVVAGTGFFKQQEVYDILNALRAIDNPYDDIAAVGALRSSLFALDDNDLMHIAAAIGQPYLPALARCKGQVEGISPHHQRSLELATHLLLDLHRRKDALGTGGVIDALLEATGYEATLLAWPQGKRMVGNVRLLLDKARSATAMGLGIADFVTQMNDLVLNQSRYEQAAVAGEADDVVRIMTIHKAKGLEFPVVFVPDLNAGRRVVNDKLLHRADLGLSLNLKSDDDEGQSPVLYRLAQQREAADQGDEDTRKLYVALTRHQDHLVLLGADYRYEGGTLRDKSSFLVQINKALEFDPLLEAGPLDAPAADGTVAQAQVRYGGKFRAQVRKVLALPADVAARRATPGQQLLRQHAAPEPLARAIAQAAPMAAIEADGLVAQPSQLVGMLSPSQGQVEIAVTMLADFERCPMLYHWRHELCVPRKYLTAQAGQVAPDAHGPAQAVALDAATMGTIFHRCMELIEFRDTDRQNATAQGAAVAPGTESLMQAVLAEMELDEAPAAALAAELSEMLERLRGTPLWRQLCEAKQIDRELDFVLQVQGLTLRGQIDLIYQDAGGRWHIVDYKSDRVCDEGIAVHAEAYDLQMLLYSLAASRYLGQNVAEASLYFLRPGQTHVVEISPSTLATARQRASDLGQKLLAARRSGRFESHPSGQCRYCLYAPFCRGGQGPAEGG